MKAFLLAAGVGSRLRPLTDSVPKCLVPIAGTPLLERWLDALDLAGVDEVLVNTHHLPELVREHLEKRDGLPAVHTAFEPELLGSAGTLLRHRAWVESEDEFVVCNADNLTDFDLSTLIDFHCAGPGVASLALFRSERPWTGGVVELNSDNIVVGFVEKPEHPTSDLVNAGVYVFAPSVLDDLGGDPPMDIGYDLIPRLIGRARAMPVDGYFRDIGTLDDYERAQHDWAVRSSP
jgi:mannose-1-phosphate guanylyltransferase